jgi:diguanylate cyclase (GGDEF)-like protein
VTELVANERATRFRDGLLSMITDANVRFMTDGADASWWTFVLERLLALTGSDYGFIGLIERDASGMFLRTKALTNIAWNDETRLFYETHAPQGMVFRNLNTLFGRAMLTQEPYLANDVANDPHAGGRPDGHPALNAFAGLPIKDGHQMVGLVGLANRRDGYDDELVRELIPILAFLAKVLNVLHLQAQQESFVAKLESSRELQERVLEASETGFLALADDGRVVLANRRAREMLSSLHGLSDTEAPGIQSALTKLLVDPDTCAWALGLLDAPQESVRGPRKIKLHDAQQPDALAELMVTRFREEPERGPGLLLALVDFRQRAILEDTMRRNASLEERVSQLRQQQRDNEILSECVEYLQRCANIDEGMELFGRSLERMFPQCNVALYLARDTSDSMTLRREARHFGKEPHAPELHATQCWALRTRRAHGSWPGGHHLPCQHGTHGDRAPLFCIPLFTLERNVAIFSVTFPEDDARAPDTLEARVSQFVALAQSISGALSTIALRESLQRLAMLDELTELSNRRAFQLEVGRHIARLRRSGRPFALAIVDIDHFKSVNDRYGHDVGDRVLRRVAGIFKASVRESDLVARVGGEEFAIFLSDLDPEIATRRLEAMLQVLRTTTIIEAHLVTASVGMAHSVDFGAEPDYETMYKAADVALYNAKAEGRDRIVQAAPPPGSTARVTPAPEKPSPTLA